MVSWQKSEYPGVAQLVGRDIWDVEVGCSSHLTRTKIPLKSTISEGFWSEWGDSNARSLEPKSSAIPTSLHPDIHFPAMIPRRGVKIKIFLSVVIPVVKTAFVPFSAIGENPENAGVTRLCGVSPCPVPDTATALPNCVRQLSLLYQLFTRFARGGNAADGWNL